MGNFFFCDISQAKRSFLDCPKLSTEIPSTSHGIEMPIWGKVFSKQKVQSRAQFHAEAVTKMRILNIIDYLVLIQEVEMLPGLKKKKK